MGTRVNEGAAAAPGHIRAYDVRQENGNGFFIPSLFLAKKDITHGRILPHISTSVVRMPGVGLAA
jgi:hypothetical protein